MCFTRNSSRLKHAFAECLASLARQHERKPDNHKPSPARLTRHAVWSMICLLAPAAHAWPSHPRREMTDHGRVVGVGFLASRLDDGVDLGGQACSPVAISWYRSRLVVAEAVPGISGGAVVLPDGAHGRSGPHFLRPSGAVGRQTSLWIDSGLGG